MLSVWCDLHQISDLKSIEELSIATSPVSAPPLALILEPAVAVPTALPESAGPNHEMIRFLAEARERFPTMRRIVVSDHQDLSATIHGLHTGTIDALLHRPFDTASVFTALRIQRTSASSTTSSEAASR
jgi:FixJ family two-component response regulator